MKPLAFETGILLAALSVLVPVSPAQGLVSLSVTNNSQCISSDTDNAAGPLVPYDPGNLSCVETGLVDINVFRMTYSTSGGSMASSLWVRAGLVVDSNPGAYEYQAGVIRIDFDVEITGTRGLDWELDVDQHFEGVLVNLDDGGGSGNAGITAINTTLDGQDLSFGSEAFINRSDSFATTESGTRTDTLTGSGDQTLAGRVEIVLDAFSACGGVLCLGSGDEAGVLFGLDDVSGSPDVSADQYSTWGGATSFDDGYEASFSLTIAEFCGDGTVQPARGEQCDDGNTTSGDGCSDTCQDEFCGDGVTQPGIGEQCDDGNLDDGDGCSSTCQIEAAEIPMLGTAARALVAVALLLVGSVVLAMRVRAVGGATGGRD